jgi:hypothetical protein
VFNYSFFNRLVLLLIAPFFQLLFLKDSILSVPCTIHAAWLALVTTACPCHMSGTSRRCIPLLRKCRSKGMPACLARRLSGYAANSGLCGAFQISKFRRQNCLKFVYVFVILVDYPCKKFIPVPYWRPNKSTTAQKTLK